MARQPGDSKRPRSVEFRAGNAPADVPALARGAFAQLANRGELAELVYDSLAGGQTSPERFWLVFQHSSAQLQLCVTRNEQGCDLRVRMDPTAAFRVELELEGAELALVQSATRGEVAFRAVPSGVMRLVLLREGNPVPIHSDWFLLGSGPTE